MDGAGMFRKMRRFKQQITDEECRKILAEEGRGVLSLFGEDGYPYGIPINYFYDPESDKIYFHGAKAGHKVDALKKDDKVCFTVYGNEKHEEGDWAPYLQSVVIFGRCHLIEDSGITEAKVRELAEKYYPTKEEIDAEIAADIKAVQLYEITIEHMSGKQIHEK